VTCISRIGLSASVRDEVLEDAFSHGDPRAFDAAYRCFGARMRVTALHIVRDPQAARECVHDVLLHLWRKKGSYVRERGSLEAFLVTCVRNAALAYVRKDVRRRTISAGITQPAAYTIEEDPIESERIERALSRLSREQCDVIRLAYYRRFTLSETASELGIPIGTVKGRLSAALRALRASLIVEHR